MTDNWQAFETELTALINRHSMENDSNTPDFVLAQYLTNCLRAFGVTAQRRDSFYGLHEPGASAGTLTVTREELI